MDNCLFKEYWIKAAPEKVFACFTNEEAMLTWHGKEVSLDPKPGGIYKVVFPNGDVILGEYKEVITNKKVIYTANYGSVGSTVTIELFPKNEGTTITLKQEFSPDQDTSSFDGGWDYFIKLLKDTLVK